MKRIISIVLIFAILLGLCACGAQSFSGDKLTADFKGSGHKKLTVVFRAQGLELYSREVVSPEYGDEEPVYSANLTKVNANDVTYKIVGKREGKASLTVRFTNDAGSTMACKMDINVDSKKKVTFTNLIFDDEMPYAELDERTQISYSEGYTKLLQLDGSAGPWKVGTFDENIIDAYLTDVTEDNQYIFLVTAIAEGDSDLVLLSKETKEKVTFKFNVTAVPDEDGEEGDTRLILTLLDFEFGEYTTADDPDYQERKKQAEEILKEYFEKDGAYIPDIGILEDITYYDKDGNPAVDENGEIIEENCETADMTLTIDGNKLDYLVSKTTTFKAECDDVEVLDATEVLKDFEIKGSTVRYYFTTYGFGVGIWASGSYVSRLVFMSEEQTDESNRRILYKFLGAEDEYKGQ